MPEVPALPAPASGPPPVAEDAGFFVTTAEAQSYAFQVDGVIRAVNGAVYDHETKPGAQPPPLEALAAWVKFRLDWEAFGGPIMREPGWTLSGGDFDKIRGYHLEALRWKDRWEKAGVSFQGITLLQPGSYTGPTFADAGGGGFWLLLGGAALLAVGTYVYGRSSR